MPVRSVFVWSWALVAWALSAACAPVPSCEESNGGCAADATCSASGEGVACTCKPGFEGDGRTCSDVNECPLMDCGPNSTCTNTVGSAVCECAAGFAQGEVGCVDVDECASNPCPAHARCSNAPGSYACDCDPGYALVGAACVDVDECAAGTDDCGERASCQNTDGAFTCACDAGFAGDGRRCDPSVLAGSARFFGNLETDHAESIAQCPRRLSNGKLVFFSAGNGTGEEPFTSAGGTTALVRDIAAGSPGSYRGCLPGTPGGRVLFFADDGVSGTQLWATDGTSGGTAPICAPSSGACPTSLQPAAVAYGQGFLMAEDLGSSRRLWRYDPVQGSLSIFASGLSASFAFLESSVELPGGNLLVCEVDRLVTVAPNGTLAGVGGVDTVSRACGSQRTAAPAVLAGSGVYLMRTGAGNQYRTLQTDGVTTAFSSATYFVATPAIGVLGDRAYFVGRPTNATSADNRLMQWDGDLTHPAVEVVATTPAGPVHVTPLQAVPRGRPTDTRWIVPARRDGSSLLEFYALSASGLEWLATTALEPVDYVLDGYEGIETAGAIVSRFRVSRSNTGTLDPGTLWIVSDGTPAGTHVFEAGAEMLDASPDSAGFLLSAKAAGSPKGVYSWQPAAPGALALVGAAQGSELGSSPTMIGFANGRWFFTRSKAGTMVLAATNGTLETTDVLAGPAQGCGFVIGSKSVVLNGYLYFVCAARWQTPYAEHSLWRSDGTRQGTVKVMGDPGDTIDEVVSGAGRVFASLRSAVGASTLAAWDPATALVDRQFAAVRVTRFHGEHNGSLYFSGDVAATGTELWRTDGTGSGTTLVADLSAGGAWTSLAPLGGIGGKFVFCAQPEGNDAGLYLYDGAAPPSRFFTQASMRCTVGNAGTVAGGRLVTTASSDLTGRELLVTDGTAPGTQFLDLAPGASGTEPRDLAWNERSQRYYFRAADDLVYETDGTVAGTRVVVPVSVGGAITEYVPAGRGLLLLVEDSSQASTVLEAWEDGVGRVVTTDYGALGGGRYEGLSFAEGRAFANRESEQLGEEALLFTMAR